MSSSTPVPTAAGTYIHPHARYEAPAVTACWPHSARGLEPAPEVISPDQVPVCACTVVRVRVELIWLQSVRSASNVGLALRVRPTACTVICSPPAVMSNGTSVGSAVHMALVGGVATATAVLVGV